jgi:hypothetical protein
MEKFFKVFPWCVATWRRSERQFSMGSGIEEGISEECREMEKSEKVLRKWWGHAICRVEREQGTVERTWRSFVEVIIPGKSLRERREEGRQARACSKTSSLAASGVAT